MRDLLRNISSDPTQVSLVAAPFQGREMRGAVGMLNYRQARVYRPIDCRRGRILDTLGLRPENGLSRVNLVLPRPLRTT